MLSAHSAGGHGGGGKGGGAMRTEPHDGCATALTHGLFAVPAREVHGHQVLRAELLVAQRAAPAILPVPARRVTER